MPILMFCVAFGLSMADEVFLLSRMKEDYDRTGRSGLLRAASRPPIASTHGGDPEEPHPGGVLKRRRPRR